MSVIAISRQLGSLGDAVSSKVAELLNFDFVDKKQIEDSLFSQGLTDTILKKYDEKKPGFIASIKKNRDVYFHLLKAAILNKAVLGKKVLIGRGAFSLLSDVPGVLTVRLVAPFKVRVSRLMEELSCSEKNAIQMLERNDTDRAGFHRSFYEVDSEDASNYHLVLNTGKMTSDMTAKIIVDAYNAIQTKNTEDECIQNLNRMLIAQKITLRILFEKNIPIYFLTVDYESSKMVLHGVANSMLDIENAISVAKEIAPNIEVVSAVSVVQNFKAYP